MRKLLKYLVFLVGVGQSVFAASTKKVPSSAITTSVKKKYPDASETPKFTARGIGTLEQQTLDYLKAEGIRTLNRLMEQIDSSVELKPDDFSKFETQMEAGKRKNTRENELQAIVGTEQVFINKELVDLSMKMLELKQCLIADKLGIYLQMLSHYIAGLNEAEKAKLSTILLSMNMGEVPENAFGGGVLGEVKQGLAELYCELLIMIFDSNRHDSPDVTNMG